MTGKFNKSEYKKEYEKEHYRQITLKIKKDLYDDIERYCLDHGIGKTEVLREAVIEYMENHI